MQRLVTPTGHQPIEGVHEGLGGGHHDVSVGCVARIEHALVAQPDRHLAHGIDAFGHRFHRKFHQLIGHLGQPIERLTHRIHRPSPDRRLTELGAIRRYQGDGGGGLQARATAHLHALEGEAAAILLLHLLAHDRL